MINTTKAIALRDENVSAALMYGSFTKDEGDQYSDIEFYFFLKDKKRFLAEDWVKQVHPIALFFTNEYDSEVAIFENMVRGEFHFLTIEEIDIIKSWDGVVEFSAFDKMILVDKDGILAATLSQIKARKPDRATDKNILWLSQSLLNVLVTTSNLIKRQEFAHANQSLSNSHKYLLWLIRITTHQTQHWESPTKRLEKDIPEDWYAEFQKTTSNLHEENIKIAFQESLKLSGKLFERLNVDPTLKKLLARID